MNRNVNGFYTFPGGRITCQGCTLEYLIMEAFDVQPFQISSAPSWLDADRFDLEARPPASSKSSKSNPALPKLPPNDEQRQMLRSLLIDRFQLKYHVEMKEGLVYILTKGKKELKLQEAKNKDEFPWAGSAGGGAPFAQGIRGANISMPQFAKRLSGSMDHPVLDQTGIVGSFDFKFEYVGDDPQKPDVMASILTSVQGLGLKLEFGERGGRAHHDRPRGKTVCELICCRAISSASGFQFARFFATSTT